MEAKKITVKYVRTGGPFGDATCNYDVITNATTLGEFITAILGKDNYQTFCLYTDKDKSNSGVCAAYALDSAITRRASNYDSLVSMKLKKVKANGGWGNMTYNVWVKGDLPKQDRKEFERIYWGSLVDL